MAKSAFDYLKVRVLAKNASKPDIPTIAQAASRTSSWNHLGVPWSMTERKRTSSRAMLTTPVQGMNRVDENGPSDGEP
ncbi:hypothetical protein ADL03_33435 [Nocardia sp. NRRL S-836]|nr:hypothetical protein ADL03_33435 [Nocardia sp. NRRL S-836]